MADRKTLSNRGKRSLSGSSDENRAIKRRKLESNCCNDSSTDSSSIQQREKLALHVHFRTNGIEFDIPIDEDTTLAMFKHKFKSYASRLIKDFDINIPNEHLSVEHATSGGLSIFIEDENGLIANTVNQRRSHGLENSVFIEEAKGVLVTIPEHHNTRMDWKTLFSLRKQKECL